MKKIVSVTLLISILSVGVVAHEFWLEPDKFIYNVGDKLKVGFKVGENFLGKPWDLKTHKAEKVEWHSQQNVKDISKKNSVENPSENINLELNNPGTHLVTLISDRSFVELNGEEFNAYLKEDGHDDILFNRQNNGLADKPAKEFYTRYAKLLVQVGEKPDDTFKKRTGATIEIIPDKNPYTLKVGDEIRYRVFFQGKPLFGAKVKLFNVHKNRTTMQRIYTQQDGWITSKISNAGKWMICVAYMVPSKDKQADYESYWASLVFGIKN